MNAPVYNWQQTVILWIFGRESMATGCNPVSESLRETAEHSFVVYFSPPRDGFGKERLINVFGTGINTLAIIIGGLGGSLLGDRLPQKTQQTIRSGLGLMTLLIGLQMALTTRNVLVVLVSVVIGAVLGEWWGIESVLERIGKWLQDRIGSVQQKRTTEQGDQPSHSLGQAFVVASLVFCVGPMAILGPIQEGLSGDHRLLYIKAILDGFTALAFSAALGPGVILSALSVLVYQGSFSLATLGLAQSLGHITSAHPAVIELTATGGVLIMGISLGLLELRAVRVGNMLPAIVLAPLIVMALKALGFGG